MKQILLLLIFFVGCLTAVAQPKKNSPTPEQCREFKEFKIKYFAQEMELREEQRERFIELYDKLMAEKKQNFSKVYQLEKKVRDGKDVSEEDYDKLQEAMSEARAKDLEIERKYDTELLKFLTKKQLYKFHDAEFKFREKMREMRKPKKGHKKSNK